MSSHGPQVYERFFHDEGQGGRGEDEPEAAPYQRVAALQAAAGPRFSWRIAGMASDQRV